MSSAVELGKKLRQEDKFPRRFDELLSSKFRVIDGECEGFVVTRRYLSFIFCCVVDDAILRTSNQERMIATLSKLHNNIHKAGVITWLRTLKQKGSIPVVDVFIKLLLNWSERNFKDCFLLRRKSFLNILLYTPQQIRPQHSMEVSNLLSILKLSKFADELISRSKRYRIAEM